MILQTYCFHKNGMINLLSQRPVFLNGTDHGTILDDMSHRDRLEHERDVNFGIDNDSNEEEE